MGPPLRSFAADAHDCIMVRVIGPTEYKVVARWLAPVAWLRSDRWLVVVACKADPAAGEWDWECSASRLALTRARFAAYGLDPSAFPVQVAHHSVGAKRRRSAKEQEGVRRTHRS